jgi:hypothetical protein
VAYRTHPQKDERQTANIDRVGGAGRTDGVGKLQGEIARAAAQIDDSVAAMQIQGGDDIRWPLPLITFRLDDVETAEGSAWLDTRCRQGKEMPVCRRREEIA